MYQVNDIGVGSGSGAAALALDGGLYRAAGRPPGVRPQGRAACARAPASSTSSSISASGSARANGCAASSPASACATPPGRWRRASQPLPGASPAPLADAQFEEARTLGIAPLAYGADTGRRMAPTDAVEPLAESPERPIIDLRATLGRGDGFAAMLERAGVAAAEADQVAAMIGGIVPLADIRPGTVMDLTLGRRPNRTVARPLDKLTFRARFDLRVELARVAGALTLNRIPIAVDDTPLRIQGLVGASLYRSARAAGVPARAVEAYIRALNTQLNVPAGINSRRPVRHHHRASPRRDRRDRDRARCSTPGSTARAAATCS